MKNTLFFITIASALLGFPVYAWDFRLKSEFSHKGTDNVNTSQTGKISDTINVLNTYVQMRDENNRFRLRIKANRYQKVSANDNNIIDLSYQRQFSKDLEDSWQLKVYSESYTRSPLIVGDANFDNKGVEGQVYLSHSLPKDLILSGAYLLNIKEYTQLNNRRDTRFDIIWAAEKMLKNVITFIPDISLGLNRSRDNYYSTNNFGTSLHVGIEWHPNFETYVSAGYSKVKYTERTINSAGTLESVTNKNFVVGSNYHFNDYISINGKLAKINYESNALNSYTTNEWALGLSLHY